MQVIRTGDIEGEFRRVLLPRLEEAARSAGASKPLASFALTGGQTAARCYSSLASLPPEERSVLVRTALFQTDERCVPPDHPDSNQLMIRTTLIRKVRPVGAFHPMACDFETMASYERKLRPLLPLDVVHLGMGPDGHFASVFRHGRELGASPSRLLLLTEDATGFNPHRRVTLSLDVIAEARLVLFTVSGRERAGALKEALEGRNELLAAIEGEKVVVIADDEALSG
jgi:6-phosphogluconolactonase